TGRYIQPFQRVGLSHRIFPKLKTLTLDGFDILSPLASTSDQFTWVFNNIYYSLHLHDGNPCIHKITGRRPFTRTCCALLHHRSMDNTISILHITSIPQAIMQTLQAMTSLESLHLNILAFSEQQELAFLDLLPLA
ncbi:unnamed protein product, partial [Fusarium graminearum]